MKNPKQLFQLLILAPVIGLGLSACTKDSSEDTPQVFSCIYEKQSTGCNGYTYGAWTSGCATVDFALKEGLSAEQYCKNTYPSSDSHCVSSCCVSYHYRNVSVQGSACSGSASLAGLQTASPGSNGLLFEVSWVNGDVDLEMLTPMREPVGSQSPQAEGCTYSGDDRYVLNGPVESVQCQGLYLSGAYDVILNNHSSVMVTVNLKVTKNGEIIQQQQLNVMPGEPLAHSVSVQ